MSQSKYSSIEIQPFIGVQQKMNLKCKNTSEMFTEGEIYCAESNEFCRQDFLYTNYHVVDNSGNSSILTVGLLIHNFVIESD